jgi:hypothetical protein
MVGEAGALSNLATTNDHPIAIGAVYLSATVPSEEVGTTIAREATDLCHCFIFETVANPKLRECCKLVQDDGMR